MTVHMAIIISYHLGTSMWRESGPSVSHTTDASTSPQIRLVVGCCLCGTQRNLKEQGDRKICGKLFWFLRSYCVRLGCRMISCRSPVSGFLENLKPWAEASKITASALQGWSQYCFKDGPCQDDKEGCQQPSHQSNSAVPKHWVSFL